MIVKPGYRTTEFYAGIIASVAAWLEVWGGTLAPRWAAIVMAAAAVGYQLSRAITKHGVATGNSGSVPVVTTAPAQPAPAPVAQTPQQV